jgi:hypothetical protein
MAFRDEVAHIERMRPERVGRAAEEHKRIADLITSALPSLNRTHPQWESDARPVYDQRLHQVVEVVDQLGDGYRRAYGALADYAGAQEQAKCEVEVGIREEARLGDMIKHLVGYQYEFSPQDVQPMRQWQDLRETTGFWDWLEELGRGKSIDAVRADADRQFAIAGQHYADALRVELEQRQVTVGTLVAVRRDLPELVTPANTSLDVIRSRLGGGDLPWVHGEMFEASKDINARRPIGILEKYPPEEEATVNWPGVGKSLRLWLSGLADDELWPDSDRDRMVTPSMARLLDGLSDFQLDELGETEDWAKNRADYGRYSRGPHNTAFYQIMIGAGLTANKELGEDFARRYVEAQRYFDLWGDRAIMRTMALYNSELGRSIALANHSGQRRDDQFIELAEQAIKDGRALVVDKERNLRYSDQIPID